jgi:hypothetical protein
MDYETALRALTIENDVIIGLDGHLFLLQGSNENLEFCSFQKWYDLGALQSYAHAVAALARSAEGGHSAYRHVIFPNKESICWDAHPFSRYLPEPQSAGKILKSLDAAGVISFSSPRDPSLYKKQDTHFSARGIARWCFDACMDFQALPESLRSFEAFYDSLPHAPFTLSGDLGSKLTPPRTEQTLLLRAPASWEVAGNGVSNRGFVELLINRAAPVDKRLLIFGDSFLRQARYHYACVFSAVLFVHTTYYCADAVALFQPHFVLHGIVERFLNRPPETLEAPCAFDGLAGFYGKDMPRLDIRARIARATG